MSTRGPRQDNRRLLLRRQGGLGKHHFNSLVTEQLDAGAPIHSPAPIVPEQGGKADNMRMQKHTDLARLFGGAPIPLALLTQLTGTTIANAGGIHQPQAPISLLPPLLEGERAACWTAQSPIGLERKIVSREATCFPGRGRGGWTISRGRSRCGRTRSSLRVLFRDGRSKLGDAQRRWFQLMAQFQSEVPDPLRHRLPAFLSPGRVAAPSVGVLFAVFV